MSEPGMPVDIMPLIAGIAGRPDRSTLKLSGGHEFLVLAGRYLSHRERPGLLPFIEGFAKAIEPIQAPERILEEARR